jgi:hypothetical protein
MNRLLNSLIFSVFALLTIISCDDDEKPGFRTKIDYAALTPETAYSTMFKDASGNSTVDLAEGSQRLQMFQALNYYSTSSVSAGTTIDADVLKNMFSNTGNPFTDISTTTISVSGDALNASGLNLRDVVASSIPNPADAEGVREEIESHFTDIDIASQSLSATASPGVAGKLGKYLVDSKGIELAQVIQKSLIGALQLDYIGNVLLDEGLKADNTQLVGDQNYTQLEHNWDVAYGLLTLNPIYLEGATATEKNTVEFGAGSYLWEYNKENFANMYPAFLKGRAAIVNNDRDQFESLATFIRLEFEKAIAKAALGYLDKWKQAADEAVRAHAIGEGVGFIYALRFAELHEADKVFSDQILENLIGSGNGFWDLDAAKINAASEAIEAKFGF